MAHGADAGGDGRVTVIIKALDEQDTIAAAIESALREVNLLGGGEVVVVDSLSTDATVQIALRYPVRVVQFARIEDRNCAAAAQLGFQWSRPFEYVYVLDGDMEIVEGLLVQARSRLLADPGLAGVSGRIVDKQVRTLADWRRRHTLRQNAIDREVQELGGGGLYRRRALESVGYLAHAGLTAFEEAELGVRLRAGGWRLLALARDGVLHTGHDETTPRMFLRLWRNRRAQAAGMFLRAAWGTAWWARAVRKQWPVFAPIAVGAAALAAGAAAPSVLGSGAIVTAASCLAGVWAAVLLVMAARKRSLKVAAVSIAAWHFLLLAAIVGAARPLRRPELPIASREISRRDGTADAAVPPRVRDRRFETAELYSGVANLGDTNKTISIVKPGCAVAQSHDR